MANMDATEFYFANFPGVGLCQSCFFAYLALPNKKGELFRFFFKLRYFRSNSVVTS